MVEKGQCESVVQLGWGWGGMGAWVGLGRGWGGEGMEMKWGLGI